MRKIKFLFLSIITLLAFNSCEDDVEYTKKLDFVGFEQYAPIVVNKNSSVNSEVKIHTTKTTNIDRTFNILVSSETTISSNSYNVPTSILVPANTNVGVITITITEMGFSDSGEKLVLQLEEVDGTLTGNKVTLAIKKFCPFNINDFLGSYTITEAGYGDYGTTITLDPSVPNRIWITNFWDWTNDLAYYDFNPETGTIIMPSQVIVMGDGGSYTCFGSGTFNPCAGTFHMTYKGDVAGTVHDFRPNN